MLMMFEDVGEKLVVVEDVAQSELRAHNLTNDGGLMVVERAQMGHR